MQYVNRLRLGLAWVFILASSLAACGGGGHSGEEKVAERETALAVISATDSTISSTITISARGANAAKVWPIMQVSVAGVVVGRVEVRNSTFAPYVFNAPVAAASSRVDIAYVNDALINGEDRTLYIQSIQINGIAKSPTASDVIYDKGPGVSQAAGTGTMTVNGVLHIPAPAEVWTQCAVEWQECSVSPVGAIRMVRFGAPNQAYVKKLVRDKIGCNYNADAFGSDPAPNYSKTCEYSSVAYRLQDGPGVYVDAVAGNDTTNDGSFAHPWQTLNKVATMNSPKPAIYLQCGNVWRESLALSETQLLNPNGDSKLAGYGNCALGKAEISGAGDFSTGWSATTGMPNVFQRQITLPQLAPVDSGGISMVFVNGVAQRLAQWPNYVESGKKYALSNSQTPDVSHFFATPDGAPTEADKLLFAAHANDIAQATVQLKTTDWLIEPSTVTAYSNGQFTIGTALNQVMHPNMGYVLQNKLWMLDAPGEFYFDKSTGVLYLYPTSDVASNLNKFKVEGSFRAIGTSLKDIPRLAVNNIAFVKSVNRGLVLNGTLNAVVDTIEVNDNATAWSGKQGDGANGMPLALGYSMGLQISQSSVSTANGTVVKNSRFDGNGMAAISGAGVRGMLIKGNWFTNTGITSYVGDSSSTIYSGPDGTVDSNVVQRSAHNGIRWEPVNNTAVVKNRVTNNVVEDSCLRYSDGGAIYAWDGDSNNHGSIVSGNVVVRAHGNAEATNAVSTCAGVYFDDNIADGEIRNNVIADVDHGIILHKSIRAKVDSNKVWNANVSALYILADDPTFDGSGDDLYTNNTWNVISPILTKSTRGAAVPASERLAYPVIRESHNNATSALTAGLATQFSGNQILALTRNIAGLPIAGGILRGTDYANHLSLTAVQWRARAIHDAAVDLTPAPAPYRSYQGSLSSELLVNGNFNNGLTDWSYSTNPTLVTNGTGCPGTCANMPLLQDAWLQSPGFSMVNQNNYLVSFTATATAGSGGWFGPFSLLDPIANDGSDYAIVPAGSIISYQGIMTATTSGTGNLRFSTFVPVGYALGSVSVKQITGLAFVQPKQWLTYVYSLPIATGAPTSFDCLRLGFPVGCTVVSASGAAFSGSPSFTPAPVTATTTPADTASLLMRTDDSSLRLP